MRRAAPGVISEFPEEGKMSWITWDADLFVGQDVKNPAPELLKFEEQFDGRVRVTPHNRRYGGFGRIEVEEQGERGKTWFLLAEEEKFSLWGVDIWSVKMHPIDKVPDSVLRLLVWEGVLVWTTGQKSWFDWLNDPVRSD